MEMEEEEAGKWKQLAFSSWLNSLCLRPRLQPGSNCSTQPYPFLLSLDEANFSHKVDLC